MPGKNYNEDVAIDLSMAVDRGQDKAASLRAINQAANQASAQMNAGSDFPFNIRNLRADPELIGRVDRSSNIIGHDVAALSAAQTQSAPYQYTGDQLPPILNSRAQTAPYHYTGDQLQGIQPHTNRPSVGAIPRNQHPGPGTVGQGQQQTVHVQPPSHGVGGQLTQGHHPHVQQAMVGGDGQPYVQQSQALPHGNVQPGYGAGGHGQPQHPLQSQPQSSQHGLTHPQNGNPHPGYNVGGYGWPQQSLPANNPSYKDTQYIYSTSGQNQHQQILPGQVQQPPRQYNQQVYGQNSAQADQHTASQQPIKSSTVQQHSYLQQPAQHHGQQPFHYQYQTPPNHGYQHHSPRREEVYEYVTDSSGQRFLVKSSSIPRNSPTQPSPAQVQSGGNVMEAQFCPPRQQEATLSASRHPHADSIPVRASPAAGDRSFEPEYQDN